MMNANQLRQTFVRFFAARRHTVVPSSGLIPHHPAAPLLTNAGMNQFIPILVGEEAAPYPRATSVQKCFRTQDIDIVGTTTRHLTFFEMLGNFSFGDYFKEEAIAFAWELVTAELGLDPERLWITVHLDDDEAERVWREGIGVPAERVQRMGDDNFWEMAKGGTGPCGPCSEIYYDKGDAHGPPGGPAHGGPERFVEIWNLVFMQYRREPDGSLTELPSKNIDTGAGLERILPILQGSDSVFGTDVLGPVVEAAGRAIGRRYGADPEVDVSLRILADHGRAMTFLVNDGVVPSNDDRGYVLRRIIRRAVRHAFHFGVEKAVTPALVQATVDVMGEAYPDLVKNRDVVVQEVTLEEERFRRTLRAGSAILDEELAQARAGGGRVLAGDVAFRLHDTYGFPLELTREIAAEREFDVDVEGFTVAMEEQRQRAKRDVASRKGGGGVESDRVQLYRRLAELSGPTEFLGYGEYEAKATVMGVAAVDGGVAPSPSGGLLEVFLDRTPFYAEAGGQVGDTGTITTDTGVAEVVDTTYAVPGLHRHTVRVLEGEIQSGQEATARVDVSRRELVRRNHTGTHLLHWALREVLGAHVKQAGSLVAPDRLRFDFSHHAPVAAGQLDEVEALANGEVLANEPVRAYETSREEAERVGALAFFGEKYGQFVRVVEAGRHSVELCGGTHVAALGSIGPVKVVAESSIGSNLRRIEAVTGTASLERIAEEEGALRHLAEMLRVAPAEVPERVARLVEEVRDLGKQIRDLRRGEASAQAGSLAARAEDGVVVARADGTSREELRDLAIAVRDQPGVRAVVLGGAPEGGGAALVAAVAKGSGLTASDLIAEAARMVGGGGGRNPDLAVAGGRDPSRLDEALAHAGRLARGR